MHNVGVAAAPDRNRPLDVREQSHGAGEWSDRPCLEDLQELLGRHLELPFSDDAFRELLWCASARLKPTHPRTGQPPIPQFLFAGQPCQFLERRRTTKFDETSSKIKQDEVDRTVGHSSKPSATLPFPEVRRVSVPDRGTRALLA